MSAHAAGSDRPFYITTAISYVNGPPHIGHAYEVIATDAMARFKRLDGYDVRFLTGTDEYGQKVERTAAAAGQTPQAYTDAIAALFVEHAALLNISNDDFIRTTEARHTASVQAIWRAIRDAGYIYEGNYAGWYAVRDEAFYGEDELTEDADGTKRGPTGAEVAWVEEPTYFFRLSAFQDKLLELYERQPDFVQPDSRRNEMIAFVRQGLRDLSVSRTTFDWGVPVPDDARHVTYVWLDALTNYITALGYPDTAGLYAKYWPVDVHMIGKDITRFHAVYWPAFLMAAGLDLPRYVFAHGFLLTSGEKMSKSVGNVVAPADWVAAYGLDPVRYYLLREVPFGQDGSVSHDGIVARLNGDLANDLGNLAQRVLAMVAKNCGGAVPERGDLTAADTELLGHAHHLLGQVREAFDALAFHRGLEAIWRVVGEANRYVDARAPWALRKTDPARMETVLYTLAEVVRHLAILVLPVMPESGAKLLDLLAVPENERDFSYLGSHHALTPGAALPRPTPVFPRYVEAETAAD